MQHLWAPWRAQYFLQEKPKECIFCRMASQRGPDGNPATDEANHLLARDRTCFAVLNAFPYAGGHLMVAPYRHTGEIDDLTEDELKDLMVLARRCRQAIARAFKPRGFNIGLNLGEAAGAGITQHLHLHVVPRWSGDTNFMTVLSDVRVVTEGLKETYAKLAPYLQPTPS
ncbi:MAG: HIT domain-containing protein [Verrucomicrobia bacterium]|nr:HIT domain-containing protein [Verrucomicrobiota bacterium]